MDYDLPLDIVVIPKRNLEAKQLTLALTIREFTPLLDRVKTAEVDS